LSTFFIMADDSYRVAAPPYAHRNVKSGSNGGDAIRPRYQAVRAWSVNSALIILIPVPRK
jgi:hypothetical protein